MKIVHYKINNFKWSFLIYESAGPGAMMRSAAVGGILLGLIEGVGILITKMTAEQFKPGKYIFPFLLWKVPISESFDIKRYIKFTKV